MVMESSAYRPLTPFRCTAFPRRRLLGIHSLCESCHSLPSLLTSAGHRRSLDQYFPDRLAVSSLCVQRDQIILIMKLVYAAAAIPLLCSAAPLTKKQAAITDVDVLQFALTVSLPPEIPA